uniref:BUD13 homolog n=1 Tax=Phallusia mammillata TaxID=59560 RepID=A0A6F9D799_9ASCI|nr:BUD13 homolog [Phallusia mammillata]
MSGLSKEEYLKRYLNPSEGGDTKKKKRKKRPKVSARNGMGMKIFDDDVSLNSIAPQDEIDDVENKLLVEDEKPLVEEIDNRTEMERKLDGYRSSGLWKKLGADEEDTNENKRTSEDSDLELPRHSTRHDSDSDDMDLPRRQGNSNDSDSQKNIKPRSNHVSKKRRKRHDTDSGSDIPRVRRTASSGSDLEIQRQSKRHHDSDSDLEPPRRNRHDSDSDLDLTREKSKRRHDSGSDLELPRKSASSKRNDSDSDLDLPRPGQKNRKPDSEETHISRKKHGNMMSGGKGGLTSVDSLRHEIKQSKKKESDLQELAKQYKDETTVYRERGTGKKRNIQKENEQKQEDVEKRKQKEEQYDAWGKGMKQSKLRESAIAEALHESSKPLARYNDDEDLDRIRKEAMRDGDPMAAYITKKKQAKSKTADLPKYRGPPAPPNRFGILPGYRWDGVDRSTGFEKKYFDSISNREANKNDFYKWSVNDM